MNPTALAFLSAGFGMQSFGERLTHGKDAPAEAILRLQNNGGVSCLEQFITGGESGDARAENQHAFTRVVVLRQAVLCHLEPSRHLSFLLLESCPDFLKRLIGGRQKFVRVHVGQ
jgi:hypothetical protein